MEVKLNEQQYKDLIEGLMRENRYARDFYLMASGQGSDEYTIDDVINWYNEYEDFHIDFVESIMENAEDQTTMDILKPIYEDIGFKVTYIDQ